MEEDLKRHVKKIGEKTGEPDWLTEIKLKAAHEYARLPEPSPRLGLHINRPTDRGNWAKLPTHQRDLRWTGTGEVLVQPLTDAAKTNEKEVRKLLYSEAAYTAGRYEALHSALVSRGLYVDVPDGVGGVKIIIDDVLSEGASYDHLLVHVGKNSSATIVNRRLSEGLGSAYHSEGAELFLEDGANLTYAPVQAYGAGVRHYETRCAVVGKNARLNLVTSDAGGSLAQVESRTRLSRQGGQVNIMGLLFGGLEQTIDVNVSVLHEAANTESNILLRNVLADKAKAIVRGLINVAENAPSSVGYQKEDTLLLSPTTEASVIPNLEINNNDVRCTHASSITHIDDEKLFYLKSRGIHPEEGRKLIIEGFIEPIMKALPEDTTRATLSEHILLQATHKPQ
ncbi:Uncharacterised protein [uncultured archaeon]|nr:Uncharacterised protein [uncultured archaeon]